MTVKKRTLCSILLAAILLFSGCAAPPETAVPAATPAASAAPPAAATAAPQSAAGKLQIAFLDVGQADSSFILLPNGETLLIDAGEQESSGEIIQYIKSTGTTTLNYVVATHPHADHIGGMAAVIDAFDVKNIYMPDKTQTTKTFENLIDTIGEKGLAVQAAKAGKTIFDYGSLKAEFLAPCADSYTDLNNYSAVVLLTYNDRRFLFMGDAEQESEAEILAAGYPVRADILKVGHHGSDTSSTEAFLAAAAPHYAVISCGEGNSYGHPAAGTLATLSRYGAEIFRTDTQGTILAVCDGENITLDCFKTEIQPRAPTAGPAADQAPDAAGQTPAPAQAGGVTVYVTETGEKYHRDGCRYLSSSKTAIALDEAKKYYSPCSVCRPPQ